MHRVFDCITMADDSFVVLGIRCYVHICCGHERLQSFLVVELHHENFLWILVIFLTAIFGVATLLIMHFGFPLL